MSICNLYDNSYIRTVEKNIQQFSSLRVESGKSSVYKNTNAVTKTQGKKSRKKLISKSFVTYLSNVVYF